MIKAILFDHGGTLDSNGIPWKEQFYPLYIKHGIEVSQEKFDRAFYDSDDNLPLSHNLSGLSLSATVAVQVGDVFKNLGINNPSAQDKIAADFVEGNRKFFTQNIPVLEQLSKHYSLGIVSNNYGNLSSMLESEGLLKYFVAVADSGLVGSVKPDAEIFNYALNKMNVLSSEAVMVGDSVKRDIAGALNNGMYAALLWGDRILHQTPPPLNNKTVLLESLIQLPIKLQTLEVL